jgi:hypothetical protein
MTSGPSLERCFVESQDYADQCLNQSFTDSGLALQDIVNEIGARLGADITPGRYRGTLKHLGFDGLWKFSNGHSIVIEVKTTDAYRIDLNTIADYRKALIENGNITKDTSSMLLIVGRQDTGDLEAQIRGSRYAWDIRIISVDALLRFLSIKEEVEDPQLIQEFTAYSFRESSRVSMKSQMFYSPPPRRSSRTKGPQSKRLPPSTRRQRSRNSCLSHFMTPVSLAFRPI